MAAVHSESYWVILVIALGVVKAFEGRHYMNADGLSYVDIARSTLHSGPGELINGYWSPGYPALIAAALFPSNPSPGQEFVVVHALNLILLSVTLLLWRAMSRIIVSQMSISSERQSGFLSPGIPIAYSVFIVVAFRAIGLSVVTPDLAVLASVLALCVSYNSVLKNSSWWPALGLGLSAGIGYWMKAVMFPLCIALFVLMSVAALNSSLIRKKVFLAAATFLFVSLPLIVLVSRKVGQLTYGRVGSLNYAWYVNGVPRFAATPQPQGPPDGSNHSVRLLSSTPLALEFSRSKGGTLPLWYDPSYWNSDVSGRFNASQQLTVFVGNIREYFGLFFSKPIVALVLLVPIVLLGLVRKHRTDGDRPRLWKRLTAWREMRVLLPWSVFALALYASVHVEPRLVAPFVLIIMMWVLIGALGRQGMIGSVFSVVLAAYFLLSLAVEIGSTVRDMHSSAIPGYLLVARELVSHGVPNGSRLAVVGEPYFIASAAHVPGDTISALIPDPVSFKALSDSTIAVLTERLHVVGVRAIVSMEMGHSHLHKGWLYAAIDDTSDFGLLPIGR